MIGALGCGLIISCAPAASDGALPTSSSTTKTHSETTWPTTTADATTTTTQSVKSSLAAAPVGDGVDVTAAVGQGVALFSSDVPSSLDDLLLWGTVVEPAPELVPGGFQIPIAHLVKLDPEGSRLLVGLNIGRGGCDVVSQASTEVDGDVVRIEVLVGPYGDLAAGCDQRFGEISVMFLDVEGGIGSRRLEIDDCLYRDLEHCGPVDGMSGDDLPLANSALVGCVPRFWLAVATHERIAEPMTICDAESLRRDYLGLLDEWHLEP